MVSQQQMKKSDINLQEKVGKQETLHTIPERERKAQAYLSFQPSQFKEINFSRNRKQSGTKDMSESGGESLQLKKSSGAGGMKVIQRMKSGIKCTDGEIESKELWAVLHDATENAQRDSDSFAKENSKLKEGNSDFYHTFIGLNEDDKKTKIEFGGTEFMRIPNDGYIYFRDQSYEVEQNYVKKNPKAVNGIGSYPKLAEELAKSPEVGDVDAFKIRRFIQEGVKVEENGNAKEYGGRTRDDTLKQASLALFGAETARSPRVFLADMMLLDRLQAGKKYGATQNKKLLFSKMLQRDQKAKGVYTLKTDRSFEYYGNRNRGQPMGKSVGSRFETQKCIAGGKFPPAGADTYASGQENVKFEDNNIVHSKEVGALINWLMLQGEPFSSGELIGNSLILKGSKIELLNKIKELVSLRTKSYDYMENGMTETGIESRKEILKAREKKIASKSKTLWNESKLDENPWKIKINRIKKHIENLNQAKEKQEKKIYDLGKIKEELKKEILEAITKKFAKENQGIIVEMNVIDKFEYISDYKSYMNLVSSAAFYKGGNEYFKVKVDERLSKDNHKFLVEKKLFLDFIKELVDTGKDYTEKPLREAAGNKWRGPFENALSEQIEDLKKKTFVSIKDEVGNNMNGVSAQYIDKKTAYNIRRYTSDDKQFIKGIEEKIGCINEEIKTLNQKITKLEEEKEYYDKLKDIKSRAGF